ncbi:MAG: hypothetical protein LBU05_00440 [Bifidobacteriaceae bacterium]|jgi:hypothetical protein|nr:hypothetical protein [Bifidobacteriaceae bacterium]
MRKSLAIVLICFTVTACGSGGGDEVTVGEPKLDDSTVSGLNPDDLDQLDTELTRLPQPGESLAPDGQAEGLPAKPEDGWISAPWVSVVKPDPNSQGIQILYVAGDVECHGSAGFTLEETDSKVTLGAYVFKSQQASECPDNGSIASKWGTVKLAKPLGDRELYHAGLDEPFADLSFDPTRQLWVRGASQSSPQEER